MGWFKDGIVQRRGCAEVSTMEWILAVVAVLVVGAVYVVLSYLRDILKELKTLNQKMELLKRLPI